MKEWDTSKKEDRLMIPDKDICAGSVFEGLVDHKKIVVEKVIDNHDGIK